MSWIRTNILKEYYSGWVYGGPSLAGIGAGAEPGENVEQIIFKNLAFMTIFKLIPFSGG